MMSMFPDPKVKHQVVTFWHEYGQRSAEEEEEDRGGGREGELESLKLLNFVCTVYGVRGGVP